MSVFLEGVGFSYFAVVLFPRFFLLFFAFCLEAWGALEGIDMRKGVYGWRGGFVRVFFIVFLIS